MQDAQPAPSAEQLAQRFVRSALGFAQEREVNANILLQFGSISVIARVREGTVFDVVSSLPPLQSWDYALRGTERAWWALWQPMPAPGWHDIFALAKRREFWIEGQLQPLMANLQFVKDLAASPRSLICAGDAGLPLEKGEED